MKRALLLLIVSGCASTAEYRERPATLEMVATKPPVVVRDCVQMKLETYALMFQPRLSPRGDGYVFQWNDPRIFLDIIKDGEGSKMSLHHHGVVYRREITETVKGCA